MLVSERVGKGKGRPGAALDQTIAQVTSSRTSHLSALYPTQPFSHEHAIETIFLDAGKLLVSEFCVDVLCGCFVWVDKFRAWQHSYRGGPRGTELQSFGFSKSNHATSEARPRSLRATATLSRSRESAFGKSTAKPVISSWIVNTRTTPSAIRNCQSSHRSALYQGAKRGVCTRRARCAQ